MIETQCYHATSKENNCLRYLKIAQQYSYIYDLVKCVSWCVSRCKANALQVFINILSLCDVKPNVSLMCRPTVRQYLYILTFLIV